MSSALLESEWPTREALYCTDIVLVSILFLLSDCWKKEVFLLLWVDNY